MFMQMKRGTAIDITHQLTPNVAVTLSQWIGGYTVIKNQKTQAAKIAYQTWCDAGQLPEDRPVVNTQVAYLNETLPFLRELPSQIRRNAGVKWFESMNAAKSGLRKQPVIRHKNKKRNCYVTNELFDVQALDDKRCIVHLKSNAKKGNASTIIAGFVLPFSKDNAGKALYLSRQGARFWLSMSYDKDVNALSEKEVKGYIGDLTDEDLSPLVMGFDLGVAQQVTDNHGGVYHMPDEAIKKLESLEIKIRRYQRRAARVIRANDRVKGKKHKRTNGEKRALAKVAKLRNKQTHISDNNAHHLSKDIAVNTPLVATFENMTISNLMKAPKAKICQDTGKCLRNGRAAKKGLNKVLKLANMGKIRQLSAYKLAERGKLLIQVKTAHSSQTCSVCGYVDKANRLSQAIFHCQSCHHEENADSNAAKVLQQRGLMHLRSDTFTMSKTVRKISARKIKGCEKTSLGRGDYVRLSLGQAKVNDALNTELTTA
jgi:putative transposase